MSGDGNAQKDEKTFIENLKHACVKLAEVRDERRGYKQCIEFQLDMTCVIEPMNTFTFPNYMLTSYEQGM